MHACGQTSDELIPVRITGHLLGSGTYWKGNPMSFRTLFAGIATLAVAFWASAPSMAEDKNNTHKGTVVKAEDGKLTMTMKGEEKEHSHAVATDAKITFEGKECKLEDLKKGYQITVTTEKVGEKTMVTKIEATKAV